MYRLILDPVAEEQITAVPNEALRPLAELFTLLETAPWSGQPSNPSNPSDPSDPRANMLTHTFGERGLATYIVLDDRREVYLIHVSARGQRPKVASPQVGRSFGELTFAQAAEVGVKTEERLP